MQVKHATASIYLFGRFDGWRLGVIEHPRLGGVLVPGGHVEVYETPAEAAVRELREETGLEARFLPAPGQRGLPGGYPHQQVAPPWWTVEMAVPADSHHPAAHIHLDHHYLAVAEQPGRPVAPAGHPLHWVTAEELPGLETPLDVKVLGAELFRRIDTLAALP
jgi:8-oxo-dGTP pyrophosphatase MutT (NUDIX family)